MRLTRLELQPFALGFRTPLRTARGTYARREGFLVQVQDDSGLLGQGEAMPLPEFGTESPEACEAALRAAASQLEGQTCAPLLSALPELLAAVRGPAARHALELALLELLAKRRALPLAQLLSEAARPSVQVNALLGARAPDALAQEARDALAQGFATLKVKVGGVEAAEDAARLAALREAVGQGPSVRVDANGAWTARAALEALALLAPHRLELCEQPVAAEDLEGWRRLRDHAGCALAADESLAVPGAVDALLAEGCVQVLVLKPMVLGGLLPALALARRAAALGVGSYVTSSLDGVVARAGAAHLAAALPSGDLASGLAVGSLFADEPVHPYAPVRGRIVLPAGPGLGLAELRR